MYDHANAIPVTDYGIDGLSFVDEASVTSHVPLPVVVLPEEAFITKPANKSFSAMKIARAVSGETEVRLLAEKVNGVVNDYILESVTLLPSLSTKREAVRSKRKKEKVSEEQAIAAFEAAVAKQYPAETLRNGKTFAIHISLK